MDIQEWYHHHGLRPGYVREQWKKLSEIFGHKPLYYVTHSYYNAVWAFNWDGEDVLIYKDQRGFSIQVRAEFPLKKTIPFLQYLKEILYH